MRRLANRAYAAMARCTNPEHRQWPSYGGRGIQFLFVGPTECAEWVRKHLPHRDYVGLELDRIDNNGHYAPGNLRLATRGEQVRNRRNTVWVTWRGERTLAVDWASPYAKNPTMRYARMGMSGEEIVAQAETAILEKRKNWRGIAARLAELGYTT